MLKDEIVKQLKSNDSVKTLGVFINPSLNWNNEHEHVKNKLIKPIKKIMIKEIIIFQVHVIFNMCILINLFFGRRMVNFSDNQMIKLKK